MRFDCSSVIFMDLLSNRVCRRPNPGSVDECLGFVILLSTTLFRLTSVVLFDSESPSSAKSAQNAFCLSKYCFGLSDMN